MSVWVSLGFEISVGDSVGIASTDDRVCEKRAFVAARDSAREVEVERQLVCFWVSIQNQAGTSLESCVRKDRGMWACV